jgi:predicted metal-binding membrane protein
MLLMFGLGVGHLLWMAGLAGIMLLERSSLRGRRVVPIVGAIFLIWGIIVLWHPAWLPGVLTGATE